MALRKNRHRPFHLRAHTILLLIGIIGMVAVVVFERRQLALFLHILGHARWYLVAGIICTELISYTVNAFYYRSISRVFGYNLSTYRFFEGALASNFANYILPSAGIAGAGFLSQVLSPEVPRGEGALTQFMRYAYSTLATLIMLPIGIVLIVLDHNNASSASYVVKASILCTLIILIFTACVAIFIRHKTALRHFAERMIDKLGRWVGKDRKRDLIHFIGELDDGIHTIAEHKRRLVIPFVWSIAYILIAIIILFMVFLALSAHVTPGTVIMAYLLATIVSVFGGEVISVGVFELGMAATLVALGQPFALAASVTIFYKFLNLAVGLPLGFYYYKKYLPK